MTSFYRYCRYKIPGERLIRDLKYTALEKFAIFDRNRRLSRKRYEVGPWLPWITDMKS